MKIFSSLFILKNGILEYVGNSGFVSKPILYQKTTFSNFFRFTYVMFSLLDLTRNARRVGSPAIYL